MKTSLYNLRAGRDRLLAVAARQPGGAMTPAQHDQLRRFMVAISEAEAEKRFKHWVGDDPKLKG